MHFPFVRLRVVNVGGIKVAGEFVHGGKLEFLFRIWENVSILP